MKFWAQSYHRANVAWNARKIFGSKFLAFALSSALSSHVNMAVRLRTKRGALEECIEMDMVSPGVGGYDHSNVPG